MVSVVISIGSNCGHREEAIHKALTWLSDILKDFRFSDIYETPPAGNSTSRYLNCVAAGFYPGNVNDLQNLCKTFERESGRNEECRKTGSVPIDIDIVVAGDIVLKPWDYRQEFFLKGYWKIGQPY